MDRKAGRRSNISNILHLPIPLSFGFLCKQKGRGIRIMFLNSFHFESKAHGATKKVSWSPLLKHTSTLFRLSRRLDRSLVSMKLVVFNAH
jgi:hypothetical protein